MFRLPEEMVGKTIEIIVVEINPEKTFTKAQRMREIEALTKSTVADLTGFKFNRDEANNYDDQ